MNCCRVITSCVRPEVVGLRHLARCQRARDSAGLPRGLEEGVLPHDRTLNPQANDHCTSDIDEERRLCYVGITRAKDELGC